MKVFIGVGHGGSDSGAIGYLIEKDVNLLIAKACYKYLFDRNIDVVISRNEDVDDPLDNKISRCNNFNPDLAIDIHNNAGGGNGFEAFYSIVEGTGKVLARNIQDHVVKLGQNSRGIKTRTNDSGYDYFGYIRDTTCPAVICEGAFIDNEEDYHFIDSEDKCEVLGIAYAKGILDTLGVDYDTFDNSEIDKVDKEDFDKYYVKVLADVLNIRSGPGLSYSIVGKIADEGVYTIIGEAKSDGYLWGKLLSGAGWIALDYTKKLLHLVD